MKKIISTLAFSYLVLPALVLAQDDGAGGGLADGQGTGNPVDTLATGITGFINEVLVPLVFAIAFLVFIWGVFQYFILGGSDEGKRESGKSLMLWAIIGFVLMVSIWGIVNLFADTLGLEGEGIDTPTINTGSGG